MMLGGTAFQPKPRVKAEVPKVQPKVVPKEKPPEEIKAKPMSAAQFKKHLGHHILLWAEVLHPADAYYRKEFSYFYLRVDGTVIH